MAIQPEIAASILDTHLPEVRSLHLPRGLSGAAICALLLCLSVCITPSAQAQTYTVLHAFLATDGALPYATPTLDKAGNVYGTTYNYVMGYNWGTVWRVAFHGSGWTFSELFPFPGGYASYPYGGVTFGPDGALYGTTEGSFGKGVVYRVAPPPSFCRTVTCYWYYSGLYQWAGSGDAAHMYGEPVFDAAGTLYATSYSGGQYSGGTVFKLTPTSGGGWAKTVIHDFGKPNDGKLLYSGLVFDKAGNLYGVTSGGGNPGCYLHQGCGTVYELTPSGDSWTEKIIHYFSGQSDGTQPYATLIIDDAGNLYGSTTAQGPNGGGTVFELTPSAGGWTFNLLYAFEYSYYDPWPGPHGQMVMDPAGTLYGITGEDGPKNTGNIFKLTPSGSGYTYSSLYTFCSQPDCIDGGGPLGGLARDADGNLYGTTSGGGFSGPACGNQGCGVVFKFTP